MDNAASAPEWPATRWALTAPESFVLLNGPSASGSQAFKLGVMELVGRGALALDSVTEGSFRHHQVAVLRDGARPGTPRERSLEAIWSIYQRTPTQMYGSGQQGTQVAAVAKVAVRHYGGLTRYVSQDVLPALVEHGLYERKEGRILWIIPTKRYVLTPDGESARAELERLLALGQQEFVGWADDDPNRALGYASFAGAALLLQPDLFPHLQRARSTGDGGAYYGTPTTDGDDDVDFGGFDFSGLDLGDFGGFDAVLSAIDSAIDAGGGSESGGDGGGGDSGGDSGGGGGGDSGGGGGK